MVYVDSLIKWPNGKGFWKDKKSCHLIADSIPELLEFAEKINLDLARFQNKKFPHFDLTEDLRIQAIEAGARDLDRKEFVTKMREIRERLKTVEK
jgi:hypothetical protein